MRDPFQVVRDFEQALCDYTGARYAVTCTSCTMALLLAVAYHLREGRIWTTDGVPMKRGGNPDAWGGKEVRQCVEIPRYTYAGVAMSIRNAGGAPTFRDQGWRGAYQLKPLPVWDSARLFSGGMVMGCDPASSPSATAFRNLVGQMVCVSFHHTKTLGLTNHGGAILHDDPEADEWLRRARFDGRKEGVAAKDDAFPIVGWHCYMTPATAAEGLQRLRSLPRHNEPLPWGPGTDSDYPDLSKLEIFR